MALISVITLPNGQSYDLRDNKAGHFLGTSTTAIAAGTITTATIGGVVYALNPTGSQVALRDQDIVLYGGLVFIANITKGSSTNTGDWTQLTFAAAEPLVNGVTVDGVPVVDSTTKIADIDTTGTASGTGANTPYAASTNPVTTKAYVDANDKIQGVKVNGTALTPDSNKDVDITSIPAAIVAAGALANGMTATTQLQGDNSTKLATTAYVDKAVENLPQAMIFCGTLGTGGTIPALPEATANTVGDVYKVIVKGTYASKAAEVGDLFICAQGGTSGSPTYSWELIPSGDVPDGTVTSVGASGNGIKTDQAGNEPITTSGAISLALKGNSSAFNGAAASVATSATTDIFPVALDSNGDLAVNVPYRVTDGTYNAATNKIATESTVTTAIEALDATISGTPGSNKAVTAFSQTEGAVSVTFADISITTKNVTDINSSTGTVYGVANASEKLVTGLGVSSPSSTAPTGAIVPAEYDATTETLNLKYITVSDVTPTTTSNILLKKTS